VRVLRVFELLDEALSYEEDGVKVGGLERGVGHVRLAAARRVEAALVGAAKVDAPVDVPDVVPGLERHR
jgi:hypothetical protein